MSNIQIYITPLLLPILTKVFPTPFQELDRSKIIPHNIYKNICIYELCSPGIISLDYRQRVKSVMISAGFYYIWEMQTDQRISSVRRTSVTKRDK